MGVGEGEFRGVEAEVLSSGKSLTMGTVQMEE
jgi:hypothetical protein